MSRPVHTLLAALLLASPAAAQPAIRWQPDAKRGIAQARQSRLPLMFYVLGRSDDRDDDIEDAQRRALADPRVVALSRRFVTVRLSRSRYPELLERWQVPRSANMWIVFATPQGEALGVLDSAGATRADSLAQKMSLVFRAYRGRMFARQLKPKLADERATPAELRAALRAVAGFTILSADQSVIKLLARRRLDSGLRKTCYEVLAALSTPAAVNELLKRAAEHDQLAADALARCTPAGAELMLDRLGGPDPDLHVAVYNAVTRICDIRNRRSQRFWSGRLARIKQQEIERVRRLVRDRARRWKQRYEQYR